MLCPNCNTEVPEGKKFCGVCGQRLVPPTQPQIEVPQTPYPAAPVTPPPGTLGATYAVTPPAKSSTSIFAILSLIIGIVSLPLGFCYYMGIFTGLIAVVLGIVGLVQINNSGGAQSGKWLAIGGLIASALAIILPICLLILVIIGVAVGNTMPTP